MTQALPPAAAVAGSSDAEARAARVRGAQLNATLLTTPWTMAINLLNIVIVVSLFRDRAPPAVGLAWLAALLALIAINLQAWRRRIGRLSASRRTIRMATVHATALAFLWGAATIHLFPGPDGTARIILASFVAGMIGGGAFSLSPLPQAALSYVWMLTGAALVAIVLAGRTELAGLAALLLTFAAFLSRLVLLRARAFRRRVEAEIELVQRGETIALLLRDFEAESADWLWRTDAAGRLRDVGGRLAHLLGRPPEQLEGAALAELVEPIDSSETNALRRALASNAPFDGLLVRPLATAMPAVWSLTARPMLDAEGRPLGHRGVGSDVTRRHAAEQALVRLARVDEVTGLPNRHAFQEEMRAACAARRPMALYLLDLDQFKWVNDTMGHPVGDALLGAIGARLQRRAGPEAVIARIGGDEFAAARFGVAEGEGPDAFGRSLLDAFVDPFAVGDGLLAVGASAGVAIAPRDGATAEELLQAADLALYVAKSEGRGVLRAYRPEMSASARRRRGLEAGLRAALGRGELALVYQPSVDLLRRAVTGCEALLRWRSAEQGAISPAEFIPVAEECGAILPIGAWALAEALNAAGRWPGHARVAVNLSALQVKSPRLVAEVAAALEVAGLDPARLELEITESAYIGQDGTTQQRLRELRALGVRVALDDFGTGYSSLSYLRSFAFDKVKIDKSFVDMIGGREGRAIVRTIIDLAATLGMTVTAEGVETPAQAAVLADLGCDEIQGYLFSRPVPPDAAAGLIADPRAAW